MAEGSSSGGPKPNGIIADLKEKKIGISGPNVALICLIMIIGWVAWDRSAKLRETLKTWQDDVRAMETRLGTKVDSIEAHLQQQALMVDGRLNELKHYLEDRLSEMARREEIHNWNTLNPERAVPLRGDTPQGRGQERQ